MKQILTHTLALAMLTLVAATPAAASGAARSGATIPAIVATSRGNSVAYDTINKVYLVVSAQGGVNGRFVDRNGNLIGAQFPIQGAPGPFGMYPHATFSPDANGGAGGFLVVWSSADTQSAAFVHGRMVAYPNGPYGADNILSMDGSWYEEGVYGAYSQAHQEFLLVYRTFGTYLVRGLRVGNNATALGAIFTISQTGQFEDNPSVAYNPAADNYLVCWKGFSPANFGFVDCRFIAGGTNDLGAGPIRVRQSAGTWITDTTYNPTTNQFLVSWRDSSASIASISGRLVNADGSLPGAAFPISTLWQAYDGLGVAYNKITRSFFMVSHCGSCAEDGGVEMADNGQPIDNGFKVTLTNATGNFYPQIAAGADDPNWLVSTSTAFTQTSIQLITGTAVGPPAGPQMNIDQPLPGAVTSPFVVSGWAVDLSAQTGSGADAVHIWAAPTNGAPPIFLTATTPSLPRQDIAGAFGSNFLNSGYWAKVSLPVGSYQLMVFMFSNVTQTFNAVRTVNIQVTAVLPQGETMRATDYDGDARSEITVYNTTTGVWSSLLSNGNFTTATNRAWGGQQYTPVPGDYDGDGKADLGVYDQGHGMWYVLLSSSGFTTSLVKPIGGPDWVPAQGDYDGDGKTDPVVYNPTTGLWFGLKSSTNYTTSVSMYWGGISYVATPGDYDGDGKADLAVYQPQSGNWYVLLSGANFTTSVSRGAGGPGWDPVQADYDGDGKTDFVVYNKNMALWYGLKSGSGYTTSVSVYWGGPDYTPVRGDFDGDGKADIAVYQGTTGNWYILLSSTGYTTSLSRLWGGVGYLAMSPFQ